VSRAGGMTGTPTSGDDVAGLAGSLTGTGWSEQAAMPNMISRLRRAILQSGLICLLTVSPGLAEEFVCFVYHRFGDDRYPSTNIAVDAFRGQLEYLRDEGFTVLTLGDALVRLDAGSLGGPTAVLTVDDGYDSFRTGALPLLQEFGMPATLFVNTNSIGRRGMLDWDDLTELLAQGMEIGNHTATHDYFLDLPPAGRSLTFGEDVAQAQGTLTERLGQAPKLFSFPFGEYDPDMRASVERLGFAAAVAQNSGVVSSHADRFALPRFPMGGPYATVDGFKRKARMLALPVVAREPESPVVAGDSAPWLTLRVVREGISLRRAQCFVAGASACSLQVEADADTATLRVHGHEPLQGRRTLYTVTAPSTSGPGWHWFSHVWVRPRTDYGATIRKLGK